MSVIKPKTKVISLANQRASAIHWTNHNSKQLHVADAKRGKTSASDSRLVDNVARVFETIVYHSCRKTNSSEPITTRSSCMQLTQSAGKRVQVSHDWLKMWCEFLSQSCNMVVTKPIPLDQSQLEVITCSWRKARENECERFTIGWK